MQKFLAHVSARECVLHHTAMYLNSAVKIVLRRGLQMAITLKGFVIQTLRDSKVDRFNFRYDHLLVFPQGFRSVADLIQRGHISMEIGQITSNYEADTAPGTTRIMRLYRLADRPPDGRIVTQNGATGLENNDVP